jgi:peptidoglycan/LPS O-acetylase OafA/YrhL
MALTLSIWLIRSAGVPIRGSRLLYAAAALALVLPMGIATALDRTVSWGLFGWAMGYAALGVLLLESPPHRRLGAVLYGSAVAALVLLVSAIGEHTWPTAFTSPFRVVAALGMVWMLVGLTMTPGLRFAAIRLGGLTFGVYLVHPLLLQLVRLVGRPGWPLELLPTWAHLGLMLLVAIVGSFALVALWHRSALLTRWLG